MFGWYGRVVKARPISVNTVTAGGIAFLGDLVAQGIEEERQWDRHRSLVMLGWGLGPSGAPMYFWFRFLDRWGAASPAALSVFRRVGLNQVTMAPLMNSLFFGYITATDGRNRNDPRVFLHRWWVKLGDDFWPTTARSMAFWSPAHVFNFYFVPSHLRVLYLSTGLAAWTCYLSLVGHRRGEEKANDD